VSGAVAFCERAAQLLIRLMAERDAQAGAEIKGQRGVSDGCDVLVAGEIVELRIELRAAAHLIGQCQIKLGITVIEVAIGQQQVTAVRRAGVVAKKRRVIAAAGVSAGQNAGPLVAGVGHRGEAGVRRPAEGSRADQGIVGADGNVGEVGIEARRERI